MKQFRRNDALIIELDSISELARIAAQHESIKRRFSGYDSNFVGRDNYATTIEKTLQGDDSLVASAQALLDQFTLDVETTRKRSIWDVAGVPIVPAAMSGFPLSMRRKVPIADQSAPLTIAISTTSSAGISPEALAQRGVACLALVMKLTESRPVNLIMFQEANGTAGTKAIHLVTNIDTKPLSLAHACHALTSQGYTRGLGMGFTFTLGDTGGWPNDYHSKGYAANLKLRLGLGPHDVIIGGWHLDELRNPHQWIKDKLAEIEASFKATEQE